MATSCCCVVVRVASRRSFHSPLTASTALLFPRYSVCSPSSQSLRAFSNVRRAECSRIRPITSTSSLLPTASPALMADVRIGRTYYSTKPGFAERIKVTVKEYGPIGIAFYLTVSLMSLGTCYLLVDNGLDVERILNYFNISPESSSLTKGASTFAIAYVFHKFLLPVRATVTVMGLPLLVRFLRARGWMKQSLRKVTATTPKK